MLANAAAKRRPCDNAAVSFDLTKAVCAAQEWTPAVLAARHARLMAVARVLWGMA